jgi:hypothetical protein
MNMCGFGHLLKAVLIAVHRWTGLAFCLLFLSWFCSGVVMMYTDYPMVTPALRLAHLPTLASSTIRLTPKEAWASLHIDGLPERVLLSRFDGRPAYRFYAGGDQSIVYADNGEVQTGFPAELTLRIASAWTGQPPAAAIEHGVTEADQWTVSGEFREPRPLRKYEWPDGEVVYVSTVTGEVVQYTTRRTRVMAYLGPIPHWLYFTPLRKNGRRWSSVVIWASGCATGVTLLGLIVGIWTYAPSKPFRYAGRPSSIPYAGPKRWHMALGLFFGTLACTWAFSGMLSMDPFPAYQSGGSGDIAGELSDALRQPPADLSAFDSRPPGAAISQLGPSFQAKELEITSFAGTPVYIASAFASESMVMPVYGEPAPEFDRRAIIATVSRAAPAPITETKIITEYDSYYLDRHHSHPLPVIFVQLADKGRSMFYIDPKTAQIVAAFDSLSRRNRWLYHGLHSMNFLWLYRHRPLWDALVLALLIGCIALSVTSLILAWNVLRRTIRRTRTGETHAKVPS